MASGRTSRYEVTPSAARLTSSLRDIGYDFQTAVADLIDNSLSAGAGNVWVEIEYQGAGSYVSIADDGCGMSANALLEALRYGSRRSYGRDDLGRFGLGLKTASLSQCRRVTVVSRRGPEGKMITRRTLDLDVVEEWDQWLVIEDSPSEPVRKAQARLAEGPGTVVIWEKLDRILPERHVETGWGRRRMASLALKTAEHLAMVFHRFLDGLCDGRQLVLTVNADKIKAWDPFATCELETTELPTQTMDVDAGQAVGDVRLRRFILPPRDAFSSTDAFDRMSGPLKWNRQQGLYVYRANRLVQFGGWNGLRAIDEHTKLARASLDFGTDLDEAFQINVAKMKVILPPSLRPMLEKPVHELCLRADEAYRKNTRLRNPGHNTDRRTVDLADVGVALRAAAMEAGQLSALKDTLEILERRAPEIWKSLGSKH
jgi:Histidine kinase-, DNA gyrase B-, and HSP90-like ATPase